jgi:hypothetical protein
MPLTVTLEISDIELEHFRSVMHRARKHAAERPPAEIAARARAAVARLASGTHSPFVARRMRRVNARIGMLGDAEWQLPETERRREAAQPDYQPPGRGPWAVGCGLRSSARTGRAGHFASWNSSEDTQPLLPSSSSTSHIASTFCPVG